MSTRKFDFSLQKLHRDKWIATFSGGLQVATITASSIPSEPLLLLLWAVRLLLLGTSEARNLLQQTHVSHFFEGGK